MFVLSRGELMTFLFLDELLFVSKMQDDDPFSEEDYSYSPASSSSDHSFSSAPSPSFSFGDSHSDDSYSFFEDVERYHFLLSSLSPSFLPLPPTQIFGLERKILSSKTSLHLFLSHPLRSFLYHASYSRRILVDNTLFYMHLSVCNFSAFCSLFSGDRSRVRGGGGGGGGIVGGVSRRGSGVVDSGRRGRGGREEGGAFGCGGECGGGVVLDILFNNRFVVASLFSFLLFPSYLLLMKKY